MEERPGLGHFPTLRCCEKQVIVYDEVAAIDQHGATPLLHPRWCRCLLPLSPCLYFVWYQHSASRPLSIVGASNAERLRLHRMHVYQQEVLQDYQQYAYDQQPEQAYRVRCLASVHETVPAPGNLVSCHPLARTARHNTAALIPDY